MRPGGTNASGPRRTGRSRTGARRAVALGTAALVASTLTLTSAGGSTAGERTSRVLRDGTPQQTGLVTAPIEAMKTDLQSYLNPSPTRPLYAGGVVLAGHDGYVEQRAGAGYDLR
jgi:hypothetical protein